MTTCQVKEDREIKVMNRNNPSSPSQEQGVHQRLNSDSCDIFGRALQGTSLGHVEVVIGAQVLDKVVLTREAIAALARAVLDGAIAEDWVVNAGLVALQVCAACEGFAAVIAGERFGWSEQSRVNVSHCTRNQSVRTLNLLGLRLR